MFQLFVVLLFVLAVVLSFDRSVPVVSLVLFVFVSFVWSRSACRALFILSAVRSFVGSACALLFLSWLCLLCVLCWFVRSVRPFFVLICCYVRSLCYCCFCVCRCVSRGAVCSVFLPVFVMSVVLALFPFDVRSAFL